jgi:predicted transcriptional regulator
VPTVTIRIDDELDARLKRRLARGGQTLSAFIREAIARHLEAQPRDETRLASLQRILELVGDTGETNLSTTYKSRIRRTLIAKHRR